MGVRVVSGNLMGPKKANALNSLEFDVFRKKLFSFLHNRGFGYQVIRPTIEKVWAELEQEKTAE